MAKNFLYKTAVSSLLFFILFFLSAIIFSQVLLKSELVTVPDLVGRTVVEARTDLQKKDLSLAAKGTETSDRIEKGLIARQDPAAGSRVRVATVIQVFTSSGSGTVVVPDLASKSLDEALTLLQTAGLTKGHVTQVHTPRIPAGRVLLQKPEPGAVVERNVPVGLLLSQGDLEANYVMPDLLVTLRADSVIGRLNAWGFKVADVRYVYYPGQPAGIVVGQDPRPGFPVRKRSRITLEVSR
jgi:beta-lactam-binding protein with PASTA domain